LGFGMYGASRFLSIVVVGEPTQTISTEMQNHTVEAGFALWIYHAVLGRGAVLWHIKYSVSAGDGVKRS
jgi:hypothetical protein